MSPPNINGERATIPGEPGPPPGQGSPERGGGEDRRPLAGSHWEWITGALSMLVVLGAIGYLVFDAAGAPSTPPRIELVVDSVVPAGDGFLVEFHAQNSGQTTAAGLQVEGVLRDGERRVETSAVEIDYVPREGSRSAGLFFTNDPRRHELEIRPTGYERP